jgi:hypothetical protein
VSAIQDADRGLDEWVSDKRAHPEQPGRAILPFGADITFPRDAWGA